MARLFEPLNHVLGTQSKVRTLRVLSSASQPLSGLEIARQAGVGATPARRALDELVGYGLAVRRQAGAQYLYQLERDNRLVATLVLPLFQQERGWTGMVFDEIARKLRPKADSREPFAAYLFGSAARGQDEPGSDLDVLIILRDPRAKARVVNAVAAMQGELRRLYGAHISPVVLSLKDAQHRAHSPFFQEVRRDARRLFGPDLQELLHG